MLHHSIRFFILLATVCIAPSACHSQAGKTFSFAHTKASLEKQKSRPAYDSLHFLLVDHYTELTPDQRKKLHQTLEKHAVWSFETLCPDTEPGTKITISGRVTDENGKPVKGAKVHIFQTNARGYYAPTDSALGRMQENDARLDGYLTADSIGAFRFNTVRPGNYPKSYEGRLIPQHIHLVVTAAGFEERSVQMVFDDDPSMMTEHWKTWAEELHYPVIKLEYGGVRARGKVGLIMKKG